MKEQGGWNPYLAGGLSGLVSIASVWFAGKYLGASTTFVRATAAVEQAVLPERAATLEYLVKTAPKMDWQAWFPRWHFLRFAGCGGALRRLQVRARPADVEETVRRRRAEARGCRLHRRRRRDVRRAPCRRLPQRPWAERFASACGKRYRRACGVLHRRHGYGETSVRRRRAQWRV